MYILIWDIRKQQDRKGARGEPLKSKRYTQEYRSFLGRLKEARARAGLTQVQAAQSLGRGQSYVSKCESGERRVDIVELREFARLYRKDLSFFE